MAGWLVAKILIIEDDQTIKEAYRMVLSTKYDVQVAADGDIGLEMAKAQPPDVILLDMIMPNMSGLEFLEAFKPQDHPQTKIVLFSNSDVKDQVDKAMKLGAYRSVRKSEYTPTAALTLVEEVLNKPATKS